MPSPIHLLRAGACVAYVEDETPRPRLARPAPPPASAIYLHDGTTELVIVRPSRAAIDDEHADDLKGQICDLISVPPEQVILAAAPFGTDPIPATREATDRQVIGAAVQACRASQPARLGVASAAIRDPGQLSGAPAGLGDSRASVLVIRSADGGTFIGAMVACALCPAPALVEVPDIVIHELQQNLFGVDSPVLFVTAPADPASELPCDAEALGVNISQAVEQAAEQVDCLDDLKLAARQDPLRLNQDGPAVWVQTFAIGPWRFAAWPTGAPGKCASALSDCVPGLHVLTLANPWPARYIVTPETAAGGLLVDRTRQLLADLD